MSSEPAAVGERGTAPSKRSIPLCVPEIRGNEWTYIKECLDTNWVSSAGQFVDRFEGMVADQVGVRHAVATVNGTAALHVALLVAGVQPGDEVIVSTLTFIAPANAVRYVGAHPLFIDAEARYFQIDPERISEFIEKRCHYKNGSLINRRTGNRVAAILPVHILGHPVEVDAIQDLAERYNLPVIEDATESLGALYKGRPVGSLGRAACFSFNGNKLLTTGGGGMIVTDDESLAERARYLTTQAKDDPIEYVHNEVGFNYRLTNLQAAMGCAQMEQIDGFVKAKRKIAERYEAALAKIPGLEPMTEAPWARSSYWMYTIRVDQQEYGLDRSMLMRRMSEAGIQTRPLWQPLHQSPAHKTASESVEAPVAETLHQSALCLPCSVGLARRDQDYVIEVLRGT